MTSGSGGRGEGGSEGGLFLKTWCSYNSVRSGENSLLRNAKGVRQPTMVLNSLQCLTISIFLSPTGFSCHCLVALCVVVVVGVVVVVVVVVVMVVVVVVVMVTVLCLSFYDILTVMLRSLQLVVMKSRTKVVL